ncbi:MAG: indole-3-glycerol-phosphate synthase TrpC [Steroidobacterales bacterium]
MSAFLDEMAAVSARRVAFARCAESFDALERRARAAPAAPALRLSAAGFDVIAEIKLRSPAAGVLGASGDDWLERASAYARAGAAAVSVLTEESRFDGSLDHLRAVAAGLAPLGVPAMRKDFIVDPYQVLEARACGAGGVLVILRMLPRTHLEQLLDAAATHGLFVLLEAFDAADLALAAQLLKTRDAPLAPILIGVNCRDLQTLDVIPERFAELAASLPQGWPAVAESGVAGAADALNVARLGYRVALVGTALMACADPAALVAEILRTVRAAVP